MNGRTAKTFSLLLALAAALALSSCGESKEDKALASVCASTADIKKNVSELQSLTITSVTADKIQSSVKAINSDLQNIGDQIPTLKESLRPELEAANNEFKFQVTSIALELGKSLSLDDSSAAIKNALTDLGLAYQKAFASLDCPDSK